MENLMISAEDFISEQLQDDALDIVLLYRFIYIKWSIIYCKSLDIYKLCIYDTEVILCDATVLYTELYWEFTSIDGNQINLHKNHNRGLNIIMTKLYTNAPTLTHPIVEEWKEYRGVLLK